MCVGWNLKELKSFHFNYDQYTYLVHKLFTPSFPLPSFILLLNSFSYCYVAGFTQSFVVMVFISSFCVLQIYIFAVIRHLNVSENLDMQVVYKFNIFHFISGSVASWFKIKLWWSTRFIMSIEKLHNCQEYLYLSLLFIYFSMLPEMDQGCFDQGMVIKHGCRQGGVGGQLSP